jgi:acyl carrier protein
MDYPEAVLTKAQRLEQLLLRVAAGELLDELNEELGFDLDEDELARQQTKYENGGRTWEAVIDGRHGHAHKIHSGVREYLYARKKKDDSLRAPQLAGEVEAKFGIEVSAGHINYLLRKHGLTALPGRPYRKPESDEEALAEAHDNAGLFSLEAAKVEMKVKEVIEVEVLSARDEYLANHPPSHLHHLSADVEVL